MSPGTQKDPAFEQLLKYLKENRGFDFTGYKRPSLMRRVCKRMADVGIQEYEAYQDFLEVHPQEFTHLFNTILINVTAFFRDQAAWDSLAAEIVPRILKTKTPNTAVRLWSAGCASGQEAYSLAILMAEAMGIAACRRQVKIYATDVDEEALELARRGSYDADALNNVPGDLREKYFNGTNSGNGRHIFRQDLRRTLVFGRHDLIHDAPISHLDLLVCRNTLIYFNREVQERIVARFHFALRDSGYLFLGRAETMLTHGDFFEAVDIKHRIFHTVPRVEPRLRIETLTEGDQDIHAKEPDTALTLQRAAFEEALVAQIVINHQGDLVLANRAARRHLGLDVRDLGRPFRDLELSYHPLELRSLIEQARQEHRSICAQDVEISLAEDNNQKYLDVDVTPLWDGEGRSLGTAIAFQDVTERQQLKNKLEQTRHELETAHEELQSTNEELETSNEELQSTVEELQTTNEELQSTNEEMETMNEELQSANSELQAINDELRLRTRDLDQANAFLESILASVDVGVVAIDRNFQIALWNERAEDLWGLRAGEVIDRSLLELDIGLPVEKLREPVEQFLAGRATDGKIVLAATNRRGQAIHCYVTHTVRHDVNGEPEGVVLLVEDKPW